MADTPVVHVGENSEEQVACKLLLGIGKAEGKELAFAGVLKADRKWTLDTYVECLEVVRHPHAHKPKQTAGLNPHPPYFRPARKPIALPGSTRIRPRAVLGGREPDRKGQDIVIMAAAIGCDGGAAAGRYAGHHTGQLLRSPSRPG